MYHHLSMGHQLKSYQNKISIYQFLMYWKDLILVKIVQDDLRPLY